MKKKEAFINIGLLIIFIVISLFYYVRLRKDKYFERYNYIATVNSDVNDPKIKPQDSTRSKRENIVQILDGHFINLENDTISLKDPNILYGEWRDDDTASLSFYDRDDSDRYKRLFPSRIFLKWYSFDEQKFFSIKSELPYDKILKGVKNVIPNDWQNMFICATILPKGKVSISLFKKSNTKGFNDFLFKPIDTLTAKTTTENWKIVKNYQPYFKNITSQSNLTTLLKDKHKWRFFIEIPEKSQIEFSGLDLFNDHFFNGFYEGNPSLMKENILPKTFEVDWISNGTKYRIEWQFDGEEILSAFRSLEKINNNSEIELKMHIPEDNSVVSVVLQKGNSIYKLQNISDREKNTTPVEL